MPIYLAYYLARDDRDDDNSHSERVTLYVGTSKRAARQVLYDAGIAFAQIETWRRGELESTELYEWSNNQTK